MLGSFKSVSFGIIANPTHCYFKSNIWDGRRWMYSFMVACTFSPMMTFRHFSIVNGVYTYFVLPCLDLVPIKRMWVFNCYATGLVLLFCRKVNNMYEFLVKINIQITQLTFQKNIFFDFAAELIRMHSTPRKNHSTAHIFWSKCKRNETQKPMAWLME